MTSDAPTPQQADEFGEGRMRYAVIGFLFIFISVAVGPLGGAVLFLPLAVIPIFAPFVIAGAYYFGWVPALIFAMICAYDVIKLGYVRIKIQYFGVFIAALSYIFYLEFSFFFGLYRDFIRSEFSQFPSMIAQMISRIWLTFVIGLLCSTLGGIIVIWTAGKANLIQRPVGTRTRDRLLLAAKKLEFWLLGKPL